MAIVPPEHASHNLSLHCRSKAQSFPDHQLSGVGVLPPFTGQHLFLFPGKPHLTILDGLPDLLIGLSKHLMIFPASCNWPVRS